MSDADPRGAVPNLLVLRGSGEDRFVVPQPSEAAEGRDVVFSGQLVAQMLMAADQGTGGTKDVKSVQTVFCRAGSYASPLELVVDHMQAGRTWAFDTVTAVQNDKLLARSLVLSSLDDPDLFRHGPALPPVPGPDECPPGAAIVFPGAEVRAVPPGAGSGASAGAFWHRYEPGADSPAANWAVVSWATCGQLIGLAFQAHPGEVDFAEAHRTISTGVMGHTVSFHERVDVAEWLLVSCDAFYAGRGRVHGAGTVHARDGALVATFSQEGMARKVDAALDSRRSM